MIVFAVENLKDKFDPFSEAKILFRVHWKEIGAFDREKIPLDPDWDAYKILVDTDTLFVVTARDKDTNLLAGYMIFVLHPHPHYKSTMTAENDIMFLLPRHRQGLVGYRMIKYAVNKLKDKVDLISLSMKAEHDFSSLLERLDFKLVDYKYFLEV